MPMLLAALLIYLVRVIVAPTPKKSDVLLLIIAVAGILLWLLNCFAVIHLPPCLTGVP